MAMSQEDIQNLVSWLQTILKETQETRGAAQEMRDEIKMIPEIRDYVSRERSGKGETDRQFDDLRSHVDGKLDRLEHAMNDLKSQINDIRNKVDRLK